MTAVLSGTGKPAELFYEDLVPGRVFDLGEVVVDEAEMVDYARRFDPQWYHVDAAAAAGSEYGGLIASGYFTVSLLQRAYVERVLSRAAAAASPGAEELRFTAPVYAGDRLAHTIEVVDRQPSRSRPGMGTVTLVGTVARVAPRQANVTAQREDRSLRGPQSQANTTVLRIRFRGWFLLRPDK